MASQQKQGKMQGFINYRMRATMKDGRQIVGQMLAFDKHMNLVLAEAEEFRKVKRKNKPSAPNGPANTIEQEEKRGLGLAIIRGANIVACSVDGPPPADPAQRVGGPSTGPSFAPAAITAGPGIARPAGRGAGLQGPAAGIGGPGFPGGGPPPVVPGMGIGGGFPGGPPPPGLPFGRAAPPAGFPPAGFQGGPPQGFPPQGFQGPPGGGRGYPPPPGGFGGGR